MTEFNQQEQSIGTQQNAGRDINNYVQVRGPWKPPVMLPPQAKAFVGREENIAWLLAHLESEVGATLGICGSGGIGKTALVAEALARLTEQPNWLKRYPGGLFYHTFYTYPSIDTAFEQIALIYEEDPAAEPRRAALRALSRRRAILVFDGVEVLGDSQPLCEIGGRHLILLLSQRQNDAPDPEHHLDLGLLPSERGIELLQRLGGPRAVDRQSIEQLIQHIGGYPLALQIIGGYLASHQENVVDYLAWFREEGLTALDHGQHRGQSIRILLQRTYTSLPPREQELFAVLGLLASTPFFLELVQVILDLPQRATRQALGSLVNFSILRRPSQYYEVTHPLIHTFAQRLLSEHIMPETLELWRKRLLTTLDEQFDQMDPYDSSGLSLWLPHVLSWLHEDNLSAEQQLAIINIFNGAGHSATIHGKYNEAKPLLQRALAISEQQIGKECYETALSLSHLAELYQSQGHYDHAESLFKRALSISKEVVGPAHANTAAILNNLALLYKQQGKYNTAIPLYQEALSIQEQNFGLIHQNIIYGLNNLAALYLRLDRYKEAEPLLQRALPICEQIFGLTHPVTANILTNFAEMYHHQGKHMQAEPLLQRALSIREELLGPFHPATALSLNNLAGHYDALGKQDEAYILYQRALSIREQVLGPQHLDTAQSLNNVAAVYLDQGKYDEAEPLFLRALATYEQHRDHIHPDIILTLSNLASLWQKQGRNQEAKSLLLRALAISENQLGKTHHQTGVIRYNLSFLSETSDDLFAGNVVYIFPLSINHKSMDKLRMGKVGKGAKKRKGGRRGRGKGKPRHE